MGQITIPTLSGEVRILWDAFEEEVIKLISTVEYPYHLHERGIRYDIEITKDGATYVKSGKDFSEVSRFIRRLFHHSPETAKKYIRRIKRLSGYTEIKREALSPEERLELINPLMDFESSHFNEYQAVAVLESDAEYMDDYTRAIMEFRTLERLGDNYIPDDDDDDDE